MAKPLISPPEATSLVQSLVKLADACRAQGRYEQAEPLYLRALAQAEASFGAEHLTVAAVLNNLAVLLKKQARYAEAETLYSRALAIFECVLAPDHPEIATCRENYASLLRTMSCCITTNVRSGKRGQCGF